MNPKQNFLLKKYRDIFSAGTGVLFWIQIFSTFSYSVLFSTLVLYTTQALKMNDQLATSITGSFIALNYFLHLLGGYIGGRYLTYRSLFSIGMCLQIIGCILISNPTTNSLLWGLSIFLGGSGLNVTCINCMVTQLFEPDDKRREFAFLWNYSGMNIGFLLGFLISGYLHLDQQYHELFLISAFGNLIALLIALSNWKILKDRDTTIITLENRKKIIARLIGISSIITLVFVLRGLLNHTTLCNNLVILIGFLMFVLLTVLTIKQPGHAERSKMSAYIILALSSLFFWALYLLAPMGLNLFTERNVDRHFMGIILAPQWVQMINTIVIILGGPLFSVLFARLRQRGISINIPLQFSLALLLIGIAFVILPVGIHFANPEGYTNFNWLFVSYILQSIGELCISPIGYAMVGQLAPFKLRGLMMGMWMMVSGLAAIFSDKFSILALGSTDSNNPLITNANYSHIFGMLGLSAIIAGLVLLVFVPKVAKLTRETR